MNNTTAAEIFKDLGEANIFLQLILVLPECVCLVFLFCGIYGMFQGIEIIHPLYTVLFLNLLVSLLSTVVNIAAFSFLSIEKYFMVTNVSNSQSIYFHCTSWCITSIIRYIYISHNDWIHKMIPSSRLKCILAIIVSLAYSVMQSSPTFAVIISYGKHCKHCKHCKHLLCF